MVFWIISVSILLGIFILVVETKREADGYVDFFRGISIFYFVLFVVIPIWIVLVDDVIFYQRSREWMFKRSFNHPTFFKASLVACLSYLVVSCSHLLFARTKQFKLRVNSYSLFSNISNRYLLLLSVSFLLLTSITFIGSVINFGGLYSYVSNGMAIRLDMVDADDVTASGNLIFLSKISRIAIFNTFLFLVLRKSFVKDKLLINAGLLISFLISLMVLFNGGGRLSMISFLASLIFFNSLLKEKFNFKKIAAIGVIFIIFSLLGKQIFISLFTAVSLEERVTMFLQDVVRIPNYLLIEFAFPFVNLANVVAEVDKTINYRWFIDYYLALIEVLPSGLLGFSSDHLTASQVNSMAFGKDKGIPVGTVTFGYMSLGILGVIWVSGLLGFLSALLEKAFPFKDSPLLLALRVNWIFLLAFTIMYGDPKLIVQRNFFLLVPTLLLFLPFIYKNIYHR